MIETLYYQGAEQPFREQEKALLYFTSGMTQFYAHTHTLNKGGMDWISDSSHSLGQAPSFRA